MLVHTEVCIAVAMEFWPSICRLGVHQLENMIAERHCTKEKISHSCQKKAARSVLKHSEMMCSCPAVAVRAGTHFL